MMEWTTQIWNLALIESITHTKWCSADWESLFNLVKLDSLCDYEET